MLQQNGDPMQSFQTDQQNIMFTDRKTLQCTVRSFQIALMVGLLLADGNRLMAADLQRALPPSDLRNHSVRISKRSDHPPVARGLMKASQQQQQHARLDYLTRAAVPRFPVDARFGAATPVRRPFPAARPTAMLPEPSLPFEDDAPAVAKSIPGIRGHKSPLASPVTAYQSSMDLTEPGDTRSVQVPPPAHIAPSSHAARPDLLEGLPGAYATLVEQVAHEEQVDVNLMLSITHVENSSFDPAAISPAGAVGLMQVTPAVGRAFGAKNLTNPEQNIRAAGRFLRTLSDKYRNPVLIASAYNAGEPRVDDRRSLPMIPETADYVTKVIGFYTKSRFQTRSRSGQEATASTRRRPGVKPAPNSQRTFGSRITSPVLVYSIVAKEEEHTDQTTKNRLEPDEGSVRIEKEK